MERYPEWWITRIDEGDVLTLAHPLRGSGGPALFIGRLAGAFAWKSEAVCSVTPASPEARSAAFALMSEYRAGEALEASWWRNPTGARDPFDAVGWQLELRGMTGHGLWEETYTRRADGRFDFYSLHNLYDPAGGTPDDIDEGVIDEDSARRGIHRRLRWAEERNPFPSVRRRDG